MSKTVEEEGEIEIEIPPNDDPNAPPRRPLTMFEKLHRIVSLKNIPAFHPPPPIKGKITVIFDLDETLVHTESFQPHPSVKYIIFPNSNDYVFLRPGSDEVLKYCYENFDTFIFTAANQAYADFIIDYLCPKIPPDHRFYRNSCYLENGRAVKYISMFDREPEKIVLVDDNYYNSQANVDNVLKIEPWRGYPDDLLIFTWLIPTLMKMIGSNDVRPIIKEATQELEERVRTGRFI